jgi:acetyl esterase/lipase
MASAALQTIIAAKRANPYTPQKSVDALRREMADGARDIPLPDGTTYERVDAGGVPAEWIAVPGSRPDKVFFYSHGGGYYRGSAAISRPNVAHMCGAAGVRSLSIDYRLAPEHPFPAAVDDALAAYRWLLAQGVAAEDVVVGGGSAGGGLTVALLLALREAGDPLPAAAVLLCPWVDLTQSGDSFAGKADADPVISKPYLDRMAAYYLNGADPKNPLASPLYGDLTGLPPMLVQVGTAETLLDDSRAFAARAKADGVAVALEEWPDMIHSWHANVHVLPEARDAIARVGAFIRAHVG